MVLEYAPRGLVGNLTPQANTTAEPEMVQGRHMNRGCGFDWIGSNAHHMSPYGLMPNPKVGTVTDDTGKAVQEVKAGRVEYKLDKGANIQVLAGKTSFKPEQIVQNAMTIIDAIIKAKPSAAKGRYIENCVLSSTMSPGIPLDIRGILKAA